MSESIGARVGRIISGSFNAVVNAIENAVPEAVMEQSIREVEQAILEVRAELGRLVSGKHLAHKRLGDELRRLATLTEQIELAVQAQRDDLATAAIASQLDSEAQIPVLERTLTESSVKEKEMEGYIQALLAKKRDMEAELRRFKTSRNRKLNSSDADLDVRVEQASSAFVRAMDNATGLVSRIAKSSTQLAELEELARNNRISERLADCKSRQSNQKR